MTRVITFIVISKEYSFLARRQETIYVTYIMYK